MLLIIRLRRFCSFSEEYAHEIFAVPLINASIAWKIELCNDTSLELLSLFTSENLKSPIYKQNFK